MSEPPPDRLTTDDVISIVSLIGLKDGVFIVGGQALNLWAERYSDRCSDLAEYGPFTSKDIDYFGYRQAAQKLADALNGEIRYPEPDDATPSTAIVRAEVNGRLILIDFIRAVLGVPDTNRLRRNAVEILIPMRRADGSALGEIAIPVMHPVHCLFSRIANVLSPATRR